MTDIQDRAQRAHRVAFSLITEALQHPEGADLTPSLMDFIESLEEPPLQPLADLAHMLAWHAAGALIQAAGSPENALSRVQIAALEMELNNGEGET